MYDRTSRFKNLLTSCTPARVGPATYYLSDIFDRHLFDNAVPFNSTQIRRSAIENKSTMNNPSPNKYPIRFRKYRIVGGTSMQNRAPRLKYKTGGRTRGPYALKERKKQQGKLCTGVPPRNDTSKVSTIPEKGAQGYEVTDSGLVKIYNPPQNRPIGPAEYFNPEGQHNYTTVKYNGNFWSLRTANRFQHKDCEGPSPAEYSLEPRPSPWQKYQDRLQSARKAQAPLLRTLDMLVRRLSKEGLPGPTTYSPFDPNTQKSEGGKDGTFSKSDRTNLYNTGDGPGPASYVDPRTALDKIKTVSLKQSPFSVDAERFPQSQSSALPGPGDYSLNDGIWNDVQKRGHSRYAQWNAPFDSTEERKLSVGKADSDHTPGPDLYYPQFQKKGDNKKTAAFASSTTREASVHIQNTPGPAFYSASESFKLTVDPKSHLNKTSSAFLTSSARIKPVGRSSSPGPDTYRLPKSTLSTKGCTFPLNRYESVIDFTPGPSDYTVHPRYAKSRVFDTHNVDLQPPPTTPAMAARQSRGRKTLIDTKKRLRCFIKKEHCPR